jgi:type VI secretion system protein ImpK
MSDDPFAEPSDSERTIIRPRPGGQAVPAAAVARAAPAAPVTALPVTGANPLIAAAGPLLAAAVRIAGGRGRNPDPEQLRRAMVEAVREFERRALATGLDTRSLRAARYALCATIDDIVLSTPWGAASSWPSQSLTSVFHNEVSGGERFFDILDQMLKDLGHHQAVVELMYVCMTLGFEGRYRVMPRGIAALTDLRDSVYRSIRQRRGEFERELSPHWPGLPLAATRLSGGVPLWAVGLGTAALVCFIYAGFNFTLAGRSDVAFAALSGLPPQGPIAVARPEAAPPPPAPPPPAAIAALSSKLHSFLAPEIRDGLVTVLEDAQSVTVRLTNRNMFGSGQATLNPAAAPLLYRIGDALREERGDIVVNGYTDNQPIHSVRFPSNFELSQARADAVGALIRGRLTDPNRLKTAGHADADPIATNGTAEGRQANRRTEIVLMRSGSAA